MIEAPTSSNRSLRRAAESFHIESVRSFTVSTSVGEWVVVVALSIQTKSETTTSLTEIYKTGNCTNPSFI